MVCFRFGQGTDYKGYFINYIYGDSHSEWLFLQIENIFQHNYINFEIFIFATSLFCMVCTHRAIVQYSPYPCLSLLLLYPTIYLTYYMSAIRQGMVIAFFLGFMLKWLLEDTLFKYIVGCILCGLLHSVGWLLIPLYFIKNFKLKYLYGITIISFILGIVIWKLPISCFSFIHIGSFQEYMAIREVSWFSFFEKIVLLIICIVVWKSIPNEKKKDFDYMFFKIYLFGSAIAILTISWGGMASRLSEANRAVIIILFPILLQKTIKFRQLLLLVVIAYSGLIVVKNINSYMVQAGYDNKNIFDYPFISVFDKEKVLIRSDGKRILELDREQQKQRY